MAFRSPWVGDITYMSTGEGWLYLASVLDLGSRRLLGYSMADHMRTELVADALTMAAGLRGGATAGTIFHATAAASPESSAAYGPTNAAKPPPNRSPLDNGASDTPSARDIAALGADDAGHHDGAGARDARQGPNGWVG
jgi:transposase InsO family protein